MPVRSHDQDGRAYKLVTRLVMHWSSVLATRKPAVLADHNARAEVVIEPGARCRLIVDLKEVVPRNSLVSVTLQNDSLHFLPFDLSSRHGQTS